MLLRDTILKGLRSFIATAFFICLAMPGSASATVILDLTDSGQLSSVDYASGSVFTNTDIGLGLGWDLTVSASGGEALTVTDHGTGVFGKGTGGELNANEWIEFAFSPDASLTGFTIRDGLGDFVAYTVNGGSGGGGLEVISGDTAMIDIIATATTLWIGTASFAPANGYRIGSLSFADPAGSAGTSVVTGVPEPAILGLLGLGLLGMGGIRRMKKAV